MHAVCPSSRLLSPSLQRGGGEGAVGSPQANFINKRLAGGHSSGCRFLPRLVVLLHLSVMHEGKEAGGSADNIAERSCCVER